MDGGNLPVILNIVSLQYNEYTQHIVINIQRHTRNIHHQQIWYWQSQICLSSVSVDDFYSKRLEIKVHLH